MRACELLALAAACCHCLPFRDACLFPASPPAPPLCCPSRHPIRTHGWVCCVASLMVSPVMSRSAVAGCVSWLRISCTIHATICIAARCTLSLLQPPLLPIAILTIFCPPLFSFNTAHIHYTHAPIHPYTHTPAHIHHPYRCSLAGPPTSRRQTTATIRSTPLSHACPRTPPAAASPSATPTRVR